MADKDYVIRLIVEGSGAKTELQNFTVKGDEAAASMKRVAKSYEDAQAKTDPVFKALLTQQREVEKATKAAADAVKYYGVSQDQANAQVKKTSDYYGQFATKAREAATAQSMLGKAMSGVQGQMVAVSAGAGPMGTFLAGLGPWGMAAAAGIGLVTAGFTELKRTTEVLAKEADALTNMAEVTGFSTDKLQALTMEAAKHGVSMEQASTAVVKFTTSWADAREGGGDMIKKLREIDPALAAQIQRTKDSATAFDLLMQAIRKADMAGDIAARNSLARAAGGRGGAAAFTGIASAVGSAGGLDDLTKGAHNSKKVIESELLVTIDNLKDELEETKKRADLLMGTIGAKPILEADLAWQKMRVRIAETSAAMKEADKSKGFWEWFFEKAGGGDHMVATLNAVDKIARRSGPGYKAGDGNPDAGYVFPVPKAAEPVLDNKARLANLKERVALLGAVIAVAEAFKVIKENRRAAK